jgi:hypothetical protein
VKTKLLRKIAADERRRDRDEKREERLRRQRLRRRQHHGVASALPARAETHDDPHGAPQAR